MDTQKDDPLEFLDFTGLEESEKNEVLFSLQCTDSNLQLPWIIMQNVPSSSLQTKTKIKNENKPIETVGGVHQNPTILPPPPGAFISHSFDQNQFQSSVYHQISPVPYSHYPPGVLHVTPIYPSFPQNMRNNGNNSPIIGQIIYSPEPTYNYAQVSPVPANYELSNYVHQNGEEITQTFSNLNNPEIEDSEVPQNVVDTKTESMFGTQPVSYGVPVSSPFPNEPTSIKPTATTKIPSPSSNITNCEKMNNGIINGHNGIAENNENSSKNKSWASLFKDKTNAVNVSDRSINDTMEKLEIKENDSPIKHPKKNQFIDPTCYRMGEYLLNHSVDGRTISIQPRGLINRSNYCYINSILQALLACPPLYNLLSGLSRNVGSNNEKRKPTPVIDSMCKLIDEFEHLQAGQRVGRRNDKTQKKETVSINCGNPFEPSWIYKMLNGMRSDSFLVEGRQEDAEEFFGCLLNGLNDEIQELMKLVSSNGEEEKDEIVQPETEENENWQIMGPKNKSSITRQTVFGKTPISNIFGGLLRSKIHRTGDESTNNIQPFFTLQLNIEKAKTVAEALEVLVSKNQLEGVTSSKTNEQVEAWQQVMIEELPVVLVLHLKCFDYQLNGCTKIMKSLEFPIDLKIDSKLLSSKITSAKEKQYKLFAVVYHDGKEASKGHYLTDAFHVGYNSWLRYDDASIKAVSEEQVLSPKGSRVPYLLFYRRSDTIRSK